MVSNKSSKRAKKPIDTTLGKAPTQPKEKESDLSHLRKPIETSISGIKQVLSLLETATDEVIHFVMYECDIMYECKICRSIFRSMANFILHKRNYCREKINPLDCINNNDTYQENIYVSNEKMPHSKADKKSLKKVLERLRELDYVKEVAKSALTEDLSSESSSHVIKSMDDLEKKSSNLNEILLETIVTNNSGVFQTLVDNSNKDCSAANSNKNKSTKLEVMEIHKILENDVPVLDSEGKICGFTSNKLHQTSIFPKSEFKCVECNHRFASQKSLTNHIKCIHNPTRMVYVCPTCKDTFANPWCVYRHLLKVHRMTNKQVRRMREQVHNSWIRRDEESSIQKKKPPEIGQGETNSENQWINDIEGDNDFQMCAGCGKHFERKAALHSHSQMCAKRLEVCNNIKENAKKKEEEAIEKAKLEKTGGQKSLLTGASKRKSQTVWSYQRRPKDQSEKLTKQFNSSDDRNILDINNSESVEDFKNPDLINNIPNILTPQPSPSKNESNRPISTVINEQKHQLLEKHKDLKSMNNANNSEISTMGQSNENSSVNTKDVTEESSLFSEFPVNSNPDNTTSIDMSIIKTERDVEDDYNVKSEDSSSESNVLINTISEIISLKVESPSPTNSHVKSASTVSSSQSVQPSLQGHSRPLLESLLKSEDVFSTRNFDKPIWGKNSQCYSSPGENPESLPKIITDRRKSPITSDRESVLLISDTTEQQEDNSDSLLQENRDLLSNEVTFEMFCKKVAKDGRSNEGSECIKRSSRILRKRSKSIVSKELNTHVPQTLDDDDDDVIFVSETLNKSNNSDISPALENGFAGFSNEETNQVSYPIDLSNLSYNNPLKCRQTDAQNETTNSTSKNPSLPQRKPVKRKSRAQSVDIKTKVSRQEKYEYNLILRAAPYMDQAKLLCIPCELTFKTFNLLLWHMSAHFSWFRFQCSKCSFITFNKYDCKLHARKQHKLKEKSSANFILPLPNWKTALMAHEFRLLKDCNDLKGKHTDEKIGIDESNDQYTEDNSDILESDAILFGENSNRTEESTSIAIEKENVKKRSKSGKTVIDIQETIKDFQKLPEPVELAMPADVSAVIRTLSFDESTLSPDESISNLDTFGDESNDDWDLPKESEYGEPVKTDLLVIKKESDNNEKVKDEIRASNGRPSRIRTKAKQNDDFVYYGNDLNNVPKTTEFLKSSSQKQRTDSAVPVKPKVSGKSVPTTQKKKI